jgi:hypothetical protein
VFAQHFSLEFGAKSLCGAVEVAGDGQGEFVDGQARNAAHHVYFGSAEIVMDWQGKASRQRDALARVCPARTVRARTLEIE